MGKFIIGTNEQNKVFRNKLHIDNSGVASLYFKEEKCKYINLSNFIEEGYTENNSLEELSKKTDTTLMKFF